MFQKEKQHIIRDYALSPRCVQQQAIKRNPELYSWKNYLNSTVDQLYKKINFKNQTNKTQKLNFHIQNQIERRKKEQYDRKSQSHRIMSKQQIYFDLKLSEGLNHKKSKSTLNQYQISSQNFVTLPNKNYDKTTRISTQNNNELYQTPILCQMKQKQYCKMMQNYSKVEQQRKQSRFLKKQIGVNTQKIDWYHLQLKQQERLYVLDKFAKHYEIKHKYKF